MRRLHMPTHPLARPRRPLFSTSIATLKPRPDLAEDVARRDDARPRRTTSVVELPRMPSLCSVGPFLTPHARSTRNAVIFGFAPSSARRRAREHREEVGEAAVGDPNLRPVEHVAVPRRARPRVWMAAASLPAPGSVRAKAATISPVASRGQVPVLLLLGPEEQQALASRWTGGPRASRPRSSRARRPPA